MGSGAGETHRPGSQAALRSANQHRIVEVLQSQGELTQAQIARATGLAPATVSNIVRELKSDGALVAVGSGGRGNALRLARAAGLVAGIDFGHRHVTVAVADMAHEILAERRSDLNANLPASEGLDHASGLLDEVLAEIGSDRSAVMSAGMGLPAPLDIRTGAVGALSILPAWVGVDAARLASDRLGIPVEVDNDANLGVVAEHAWGAGAGVDYLAYLKLSDGVGAGLILGGELFRGRNGVGGEIGHITIDEFGAVCRCGNRGCVETIVAARSVIELIEPHRGPGLTIADVVKLAEAGDTACERVLADTGRQVGIAVANLCNLVNPERILIGGELAQAGELLLAQLREAVRRCGIPSATTDLQILPAAFGPRAHVLGAIALAIQSHTAGLARFDGRTLTSKG